MEMHRNNWYIIDDKTKPISFETISQDKYNVLHNKLYSYALSYYCDINDIDKNSYRWIEDIDLTKQYWESTYVIKISRTPFKDGKRIYFTHEKVNLRPYWKCSYYISNKQLSYVDCNLNLIESEYPNMNQIDYIDYVNEKIRLLDKLTDQTTWVTFDQLPPETQINSESFVK